VVSRAGDDDSAGLERSDGPRHQRARFVALTRRQQKHQEITRRIFGRYSRHPEACALESLRFGPEALLTRRIWNGLLLQRPATARTQEQCSLRRPAQSAVRERQKERFQRGIFSSGCSHLYIVQDLRTALLGSSPPRLTTIASAAASRRPPCFPEPASPAP